MAILHLTITGMTCGKCEKIIREGITDEVAGVTEVEIDRPGGKAKISIPDANTNELVTRKEQILKIINSLVNGKFNATIDQVEQSKTEVVTDVLIPGISDIPFIEDELTDSDGSDLRVAYLIIEGMTCDSCVFTISSKLCKKPGITSITVDLSSKVACIIYDSRVTAMDFLIDHIHALNEGFTAKDANHDLFVLHIQGLNCMRCVNKVQSSFMPENSVQVNLAQGKAFCFQKRHQEQETLKTIRNLDFKAYSFGPHQGRVLLQVSEIVNPQAVEDGLISQKGVLSVKANAKKSHIDVVFDDRFWQEASMKAKILEIKEVHDLPENTILQDSNTTIETNFSNTENCENQDAVNIFDLEKCFLRVQGMTCAS